MGLTLQEETSVYTHILEQISCSKGQQHNYKIAPGCDGAKLPVGITNSITSHTPVTPLIYKPGHQ